MYAHIHFTDTDVHLMEVIQSLCLNSAPDLQYAQNEFTHTVIIGNKRTPQGGGGGFGTKCVLTFNSACKRNGEEFFTIWFNEQLKKNRLHVPDYFFEYQLNLLDNVVLSVLLYACKNADILKPVHTIFLRYILDLKKYVSQPGGRYIWRN